MVHYAMDYVVHHHGMSLQGPSPPHYLLGLKILNMLVAEMNNPTPGRSLTQHRKIAVSFRDLALYKVRGSGLACFPGLSEGRDVVRHATSIA
jgi:hypothetical protein